MQLWRPIDYAESFKTKNAQPTPRTKNAAPFAATQVLIYIVPVAGAYTKIEHAFLSEDKNTHLSKKEHFNLCRIFSITFLLLRNVNIFHLRHLQIRDGSFGRIYGEIKNKPS